MRPLLVRWLGRVRYARGLDLQQSLVEKRRRHLAPDTLLLLEHDPVITIGRGGDRSHVLLSAGELAERGIDLFEAGRGGDVTYHGPGQLVGYPILALPTDRRDAHRYLRDLEEALIRIAADYGVSSSRLEGLTGTWLGDRKLASIGVRLSIGWITSHGFALNVSTDLSGFETIVPCGVRDHGVTSLGELLGREPSLREVATRAAVRVAEALGFEPVLPEPISERLAIPDARTLSWTEEQEAAG